MSTKLTQFSFVITVALMASNGPQQSCAAPPAASGAASQQSAQPINQKPLTREDADLMLREAHSAIEQGRLEDAEKIVSRVENANVQFPLIHSGPTTTSIRRELTKAQRLRTASKSLMHEQPNGAKRYLPFSRNASGQTNATTDPFVQRNRSAGQAPAASSTASQSATTATSDRRLPDITMPAPPQPPTSRTRTTENPYANAASPAGFTSSNAANSSAPSSAKNSYPTTPAPASINTRNVGNPADIQRSTSATGSIPDSNPSWSLSNAPLPSVAESTRPAAATAGLTPPRRAAVSPATNKSPGSSAKQQAQEQLSAARQALDSGNVDLAEKLTQAANSLGVPESQYLPDEDRPSLVAWDISQAKQKDNRPQPAVARLPDTSPRYAPLPAQTVEPAALEPEQRAGAAPAVNRGEGRGTQFPAVPPLPQTNGSRYSQTPSAAPIRQRIDEGPQMLAALPASAAERSARAGEPTAPAAEELTLPAAAAPPMASDANDSASVESLPAESIATDRHDAKPGPVPAPTKSAKSMIDSADESQQVLLRKLYHEVGKRQSEAIRLREKDSERALATLREAQQLVNDSKLPDSTRRELLSRIDKTLHDTQDYVKAHSSEIELDKHNESVKAGVDRDREVKLKVQQKTAELVDDFNRLNHEQRYAEAEIVARRLIELDPNDPVAIQVWQNAKFIRREMMNRNLANLKEDSFIRQLSAVDNAAINPVAEDGKEMVYDAKRWPELVAKRKGSKERVQRHTERELEIERRLQTPVLLRYQDTSLSEVMGGLSELTGVNIHLDPRGLSQEGVNSDTPITINLGKEISLKSALNLILEPLHLSYVVSDEVLKITSEQLRDGELYTWTYNVADLVTPIPNFVPNSNIGLQGLINESMAAAGRGSYGVGNNGPGVLVSDRSHKSATGPNGNVLAQQMGSQPARADGQAPTSTPIGAGPGGLGGAANADFDSLIDLIVSTVSQETWAENGGGQAEIRPFPTNLSLVISQTQAVHEEIADLLQQLRRLQDLQVTIEVRFIRLNDSFFERIGIDFNLDVNDNGYNGNPATTNLQPFGPNSNTVGVVRATTGDLPAFTSDLDIPFRQNSFDLTQVVPFGGPVDGGLNFGFAILSDIEAFFLIEAAQGDRRTNVLNAPKITLFNGQQAFVADATQRPFVVGVIPVVGEFASAQQPVIVVLNEGTMMTIQAVVSDDRRYVRMTIVPFFTQIGDVDTFTFEGSTSSTNSSSSTDDDDDGKNESKENNEEKSSSGVTVQLPSFSFVSVVTTVSVPDGGTVLLGGIKRLNEGRNEFGVPLLSKVPYINRLFRNVSIGRETDSLMMMVTPRIIIQEEEEERLGIPAP